MKQEASIVYRLHNALYLNITNRCCNNCEFCIRSYTDGLAGYRLVLDDEPSIEELKKEIELHLNEVSEIVFCGYGEPTYRLDAIVTVAKWLQSISEVPIRLNTNGLGNLINDKDILPELSGLIDRVNVSLNATDAEEYQALCQPVFGEVAYPEILSFIKACRSHIPKVAVSAVRASGVDMDAIEAIADEMGVEFHQR